MPELDENSFIIFLKNLQKQFLCCYPLHCIEWENFPKNLTWEQQRSLIDFTCNSPLNKKFPIKLGYQLNFLKKLLTFLEKYYSEVHDAVYESYCQVQQQLARDSTEKYAFKHYVLDSEVYISLRESKSFVAEGTTGLCSWQASLALADFLLFHPCITKAKVILELGAGTGLCGFSLLKMCKPKHLFLSDGSAACVELMCEGIKRNFPQLSQETNNRFKDDALTAECLVIPWKSIDDINEISSIKPDIILAADVVYDDTCFKDLSHAIDYVFKLKDNCAEMYLAATVRNNHTLNGFLNLINSMHFKTSEQEVVPKEKSTLFWDRTTPVKIFKITR